MRLTLICAALFAITSSALAQPDFLKEIVEEATNGKSRSNDLEGGIWEYKVVTRTKEKATKLVGKLRLKDGAAFDVVDSATGELAVGDGQTPDEGGTFPFGIRPPTGPKLGVLERVAEGNRGGDRVGDVTYQRVKNSTTAKPKVSFVFDTDDKHPLSGEAMVRNNPKRDGDVWRGTYYQRLHDGKKRRWNFELRFIED